MKKILLTIGTMTASIAPIAALVACGEKKEEEITSTIKGSEFKSMFLLSKTDSQGNTTLEPTKEYKVFLGDIAKAGSNYHIPKDDLTNEKYKKAVENVFANDKDKKNALINILKANKNNAKLSTSCLIFTEQSIKNEEAAKFGLVPNASGGYNPEDVKKLNLSIEGGNIIAQEIADGVMGKFDLRNNDKMWNDNTLRLAGEVKAGMFVESQGFSGFGYAMGGRENLKPILQESGYSYKEYTPPANSAS